MNIVNGFFQKFIASLLLHGILLFCMACLWSNTRASLMPAFQSGDFSVDLNLAVLPPDSALAPTDPILQPIAESPAEEPEDTPEEPEEEDLELTEVSDVPLPPSDKPKPVSPAPTPPRVSPVPAPEAQAGIRSESGGANQGVPGMPRLESYIRPVYPPGARLRGEEGTVVVRAWITTAGRSRHTEVIRSSGYPALDEAAVNAVQRARFISARKSIIPVESQTTLTFRFTLVD